MITANMARLFKANPDQVITILEMRLDYLCREATYKAEQIADTQDMLDELKSRISVEENNYELVLINYSGSKMDAIEYIKQGSGLGLVEANRITDAIDSNCYQGGVPIKKGLTKTDADNIVAWFRVATNCVVKAQEKLW